MPDLNKSTNLLKKAEEFYKKTLKSLFNIEYKIAQTFTMPDDDEPISGKPNSNLVQEAEKFDIKDEELFNQFESFMDAYNELMNSLKINPNNLNSETLEDAGQLIDTLNTRWQRIQSNPYLNMTEGWDEDFSPSELTDFVQRVVSDAGDQLKAIAGDDISIDEIRAAQFANEFNNNKNIDKNDQNIRWTGDKVKQMLDAKKKWFNNLLFIKKVGKSHPEYQRYQNYIDVRKNQYLNIMNDPERRSHYREKTKARINNFLLFPERKQEIINQINRTRDKETLEELNKKLKNIEDKENALKQRVLKQTLHNREQKEAGGMTGLLIHLHQKTESLKSDTSKKVKNILKKSPGLIPYKEKLAQAVEEHTKNPTPVNALKVKEAQENEAKFAIQFLDTHPEVIKVRQVATILKALRSKMKEVHDAGWLESESNPEEVKNILRELIQQSNVIINNVGASKPINNVIEQMVKILKTKAE